MKENLPRGLRNNNPLNIRKNQKTHWLGQCDVSNDRDFVRFKSMPYGYRAAFKVLQNYYSLHKCLTLSQYIARWAPSNENNTKAYICSVSNKTGYTPHKVLPSPRSSRSTWVNIVAAMSKVENGRQANIRDVEEGYRLAFEII